MATQFLKSIQTENGLVVGVAFSLIQLSDLPELPVGGGGVPDGDKGDITVSGGGTVWTIDAGVIEAVAAVEIAIHNADTTGVHGIANTADLVVTTDPRLSDARTPTAHATSHKLAGSDVILLNEFGNPTGSVQFSQQQALQLRVENLTADPGSPAIGQIWFRTDL